MNTPTSESLQINLLFCHLQSERLTRAGFHLLRCRANVGSPHGALNLHQAADTTGATAAEQGRSIGGGPVGA